MDIRPLAQAKSFPFTVPSASIRSPTSKHFHVSAVLGTNPLHTKIKERVVIEPAKNNEAYDDNGFAKMAIGYLSKTLQKTAGVSSSSSTKGGYGSLVEAAAMVARNFEPKQQHELILRALERAIPRTILSLIRILLPQSKLTREVFAVFTTIFFAWLVGPSEVRETEFNGGREKRVVHIRKCRFLEQSNCVGMCTHLCKIPSQTFIKNSLGMPVYMNPNFDDMSCEMVFGQDPPELEDDPATKQPCYTSCKSNRKYGVKH
ncbi:PREDICTED: beta-carotene isomerase D27, chloroplastic [Tarenaya hassleriana]|uniref:beta-carotene isomerase D27, chloroplastic n=1 Tax=Tarenaya hassleriana TaxID=28532 RepID=UPI00053C97ED|nr:PREDICTED: beta-carotene isomerase D27, chloroplastic [Tarenaya hassleriana]